MNPRQSNDLSHSYLPISRPEVVSARWDGSDNAGICGVPSIGTVPYGFALRLNIRTLPRHNRESSQCSAAELGMSRGFQSPNTSRNVELSSLHTGRSHALMCALDCHLTYRPGQNPPTASPSRLWQPGLSRIAQVPAHPSLSPFPCPRAFNVAGQAARCSAPPRDRAGRQSFPISIVANASRSMTPAACALRGSKQSSSEFMSRHKRSRGSSCVQYRRRRALRRLKAPEQRFGLPNNRSVQFSEMSQSCFGQQKQRLTLPLWSGAVNAPPKCISPGIAIGPPMRWRSSSPKSANATECEI
jgi:hypothetical protein